MPLDSGLDAVDKLFHNDLKIPGKHMVHFCRGGTVHFIHAEYLAWEFLQLS